MKQPTKNLSLLLRISLCSLTLVAVESLWVTAQSSALPKSPQTFQQQFTAESSPQIFYAQGDKGAGVGGR
jgi:hypothetical protein